MVAYTSFQMTQPRHPTSGPGIGGRNVHSARGTFVVTANLAAADTITMCRIHPGGRVQAGFIKSDQVDSASGVTYNVGIPGTPALFFSGSTVGRTGGGVDRTMAFAGTDWYNNSRRYIDVILTVAAAPTTPVTGGTVVVNLQLTTEEPS
jgi:hypothetical protein